MHRPQTRAAKGPDAEHGAVFVLCFFPRESGAIDAQTRGIALQESSSRVQFCRPGPLLRDVTPMTVARYLARLFPQGEFWVMLHRSMAEYVHKSPDNQARMLLAYFSGMMVSQSVGEFVVCRLLCTVCFFLPLLRGKSCPRALIRGCSLVERLRRSRRWAIGAVSTDVDGVQGR